MTTAAKIETEMTNKQRTVRDLRSLADFLEGAELDDNSRPSIGKCYIFCQDAQQFGQAVATLGACRKSQFDKYLNADRMFGDLCLQVTIPHKKVCQRVKTGTRIIRAKPEVTIAAKPEEILPAEQERVEDIYEWKCPDSFLALSKKDAAAKVEEYVKTDT